MKQRRVCLDSGYKFQYDGPARGRWKTSSDERWDTVMHKAVCGKLVGHRRIDGAPVAVVRAGGKLFAATHATRGNVPSRVKAGTKFAGIFDFLKPKKKARVGSKLVYMRPSPSGSLRGSRRRRRRR